VERAPRQGMSRHGIGETLDARCPRAKKSTDWESNQVSRTECQSKCISLRIEKAAKRLDGYVDTFDFAKLLLERIGI
jgi:hypothetical protein